MSDNYLQHYGVKGMKWGVRRAQKKEYGMSKRQLKKKIKTSENKNQDKVEKDYQNEFKKNKKYNELGKESKRLAEAYVKSSHKDVEKDIHAEPSKRTMELYGKLTDVQKQMGKIEVDIGKKYVDRFNDAMLKDLNYQKNVETGRKMLEKYNENYKVRYDGYIYTKILNGRFVSPDNDFIGEANDPFKYY